MTQEKRALLAGVLSLAVMLGWYYFFGSDMVVPPAPKAPIVQQQTPPPSLKEEDIARVPFSPLRPESIPESTIDKETPLLKIQWTNRGGAPRQILLKKFHQGVKETSPLIDLVPHKDERPLTLICGQCNFSLPSDTEYTLLAQSEDTITYQAVREGITVRKLYQWNQENYVTNLKVTIENKSGRELKGKIGLGWKARQLPEEVSSLQFLKGPGNQRTFVYQREGKAERHAANETRELQGGLTWAGIEDRYFLISLISRRLSSDQFLRLEKGPERLSLVLYPTEMVVSSGGRYDENYSVYFGPKDRKDLQVAQVGLENAIDYGWFAWLAVPIFQVLQFFHGLVGNWGLAIILLTLLAKLLLNPLTVKSMRSMKEMQRLQPKLAELKEKYKNDRQRLNTETMQLFKNHKVNPMGGCFPMLLQMPIYIALYKVLYNAIGLYHAPFVGFYRDLSAPDPYFILPILMGLSMVLQQKLTPAPSADPVQKQMMTIMPVMFTAFMLFLPLGLTLYIFLNTILSVAQQWMFTKDIRLRDLWRRFA